MIFTGKFQIKKECGCYCLYRLIRNSNGDVVKKILVINTADLNRAVKKMVEQIKVQKCQKL